MSQANTFPPKHDRLSGVDLARSFALFAMIMVNFRLAMGVTTSSSPSLLAIFEALQGRAAACFVILAGIGLQLGSAQLAQHEARRRLILRAMFLMVAGLLNLLVFPADIMHYYATFFVIAAFLVPATNRQLLLLIAAVMMFALALIFTLDYGKGWNFAELSYVSFASWQGMSVDFPRHLFFNGWHPVFPWLAFLIWGMFLARQNLSGIKTQKHLMIAGVSVTITCSLISQLGKYLMPQWMDLFSLQPMPAFPLYVIAAASSASAIIGFCCWISQRAHSWSFVNAALGWFTPVGRMSLSLYVAHILIGMGTLESLGWLQGRTLHEVLLASSIYFVSSLLFCQLWSRRWKQGPLEMLMRKISQ